MACPRCDGPLSTLNLGDARAVVCDDCSFVGVPLADRPPSRDLDESWEVALDRFYERSTVHDGEE